MSDTLHTHVTVGWEGEEDVERAPNPRIDAFLGDLLEVFRKHGMSVDFRMKADCLKFPGVVIRDYLATMENYYRGMPYIILPKSSKGRRGGSK